ncbi:hypothetical protein [Luteimonas vadosa]|uniref:Uncharacterized protein n=1 Tax=Luteimonas vadosa TaxID=1165507 RepID=A0ABP9DWP0_9GAMM
MSLTLGLTGMDPDTEVALKIAFAEANERLDERWELVPENEADHVIVDMDSMYGPMSWLRLHAAGKTVVGLTSVERTQTEFRLSRPFDGQKVHALLVELEQPSSAAGHSVDAPSPEATVRTEPTDAGGAAEPEPADASAGDAFEDDHAVPEPVEAPVVPEPAAPEPEIPARDPVFADWLRPGALAGRVRYRRGDGPALFIDPASQAWHGPSALKSVAPSISGTVEESDFETLDDARWTAEAAAAGDPQPLPRLAWLAGLVAGQGSLLPEHEADGRYALAKWPQTEREYPKHFRIATAMMKGPATVAEIADASSVPAADVADFINANLVTGYAQFVPETPPEPEEAPKKPGGGLLGRLRNR